MAHIGTRLCTWFSGKLVGTDAFGNNYYVSRKVAENGKLRRWAVYKGIVEASKVPPLWHSWLHYTSDILPPKESKNYAWQKTPAPNLTGTALAYRPSGHLSRGGKRQKATGDYEAWNPNN